jgi:hypothetical protein
VAPLSCAVIGCALRQATAVHRTIRRGPQRVWPPHEMVSVCKALKNIALANKPRRQKPSNASDDPATKFELVSLPNAIPGQYPPLVLIHVILLSTALVLLPQTPIPNLPLPPPARGLDKPQHPLWAIHIFDGYALLSLSLANSGFLTPTRRSSGMLRLHCICDSGTTRGNCAIRSIIHYDASYLSYLRTVLSPLPQFGLTAFVALHQDVWSRCAGGTWRASMDTGHGLCMTGESVSTFRGCKGQEKMRGVAIR